MKVNRIAIKLGSTITLLLLVVLLPLGFVIDQIFSGFYYGQVQEDIDQQSSYYATALADSENSMMVQMIEMMSELSQVKLYIVDTEGEIIANSSVPGLSKGSFIPEEEMNTLSRGNTIKKEYEARTTGSRFLVSGSPIYDGDTFYGGIYVLSSIDSIYESIQKVRQMLVLSGIGTFFLALGFTVVLSRKLSKPMVEMEQATRKIAKGDLDTRVKVVTGDETGSLAQAINDLATDLKVYRDTRREFFANISHELRTPMTYLEGYTKILKENLYQSEAEKEQYLDIIQQESVRLTHLINDLFELSKMEEGKFSLNQEWIDFREVMENIHHKVYLKAKDKGVIFTSTIEEDVPLIFGDGHRMEQIFSNLLDNAIHYTDQGIISFIIKSLQPYEILIEIRDTGTGIPKEDLPYIFERFYRVEKSRSREHGGTGLGLAIVKQLVEIQGGTIQVFSEFGKGTRFEIRFPAIKGNGGEER
ncbi:ATP-binding protein [Salipaludibacillus sp. CF4.18]|uniref:sensor histidine kinase n=1 Tax=Salipaludibacillus sp. CF4.18 TaxID=3373081 RepID=UPI003EE711FE